jgi:hypothetical protein
MYRTFGSTAALFAAAGMLVGCGSMRSYDSEVKANASHLDSGKVELAIQNLERNNSSADKDLLYFFEKGEMLRLKKDFAGSRDVWFKADEQVQVWENDARTDTEKYLRNAATVLTNDKASRYDGYDYEKVMLSTRIALDHIALGDWSAVRTEIKKTHERESLIRELNEKKYARVEEEASKKKNIKTSYSTLKGYPVETLDDPEVVGLRNGYQSAFSHYLAGFVYEALGEPGLAAPGYRTAIELRPNTAILNEALSGLDARVSKARSARDQTDVLFVVESGMAPARKSKPIAFPLITHRGAVVNQISFPVIQPDRQVHIPSEITVDTGARVAIMPVTNVDAMARRVLRDEMPGIILRTVVRATTRAVAQAELANQAGRQFGLAGSLLANVGSSVVNTAIEQADERMWRSLPAQISIGRASLPSGARSLSIPTPAGLQTVSVKTEGKFAVVQLRMIANHLYVLQDGGAVTSIAALSPADVQKMSVNRPTPAPASRAAPTVKTVTTSSGATTSGMTSSGTTSSTAALIKTSALASAAPVQIYEPSSKVRKAAVNVPVTEGLAYARISDAKRAYKEKQISKSEYKKTVESLEDAMKREIEQAKNDLRLDEVKKEYKARVNAGQSRIQIEEAKKAYKEKQISKSEYKRIVESLEGPMKQEEEQAKRDLRVDEINKEYRVRVDEIKKRYN